MLEEGGRPAQTVDMIIGDCHGNDTTSAVDNNACFGINRLGRSGRAPLHERRRRTFHEFLHIGSSFVGLLMGQARLWQRWNY